MTTYPLPTLGPTITSAGITVPAFEDILASYQASYRGIYGSDVSLAANDQDGQLLGILSQAVYDTNDAIVTVFNGFSPTNAQGAALSSLVKINGLQREASSFSTAPATIIGQALTFIASGIVQDGFGNQWTLPSNVQVPTGGAIDVTLTCATPGAITLPEGSTTITANGGGLSFVTVIPGFQSVTTTSAATPGAPVELDATLRQRQAISTGLPAQTPLEAILANVADLPGVTRYAIYENDTNATDGNGLPAKSICLVVGGGDELAIATTIAEKKNPGTGTYGSTSQIIIDPSGVPNTIRFFVLDFTNIYVGVTLTPLAGYEDTTGTLIQNVVATWVSSLLIGQNVQYWKLGNPINLSGTIAQTVSGLTQPQLDALSATYDVAAVKVGTSPSPTGVIDIPIAFNFAAACVAANVVITT
jgi:uncharacterized phage protein gp47/JayE